MLASFQLELFHRRMHIGMIDFVTYTFQDSGVSSEPEGREKIGRLVGTAERWNATYPGNTGQ